MATLANMASSENEKQQTFIVGPSEEAEEGIVVEKRPSFVVTSGDPTSDDSNKQQQSFVVSQTTDEDAPQNFVINQAVDENRPQNFVVNRTTVGDDDKSKVKHYVFVENKTENGQTQITFQDVNETHIELDPHVGQVASVIVIPENSGGGGGKEAAVVTSGGGGFASPEEARLMEQQFVSHGTADQQIIRSFECGVCKKEFTKVEVLRRHVKIHEKDKEYKCSYCNKCFDRRDVLNDHLRNHTGEKPFQCTICQKKFTRGFVLLRHMRTHNTGLYKCEFCLKAFDRKDTFRDHIRNHTGEKPFECRYCGKAFSRSFVMTKHEKAHVVREDLEVREDGDMEDISDHQPIMEEIVYDDNSFNEREVMTKEEVSEDNLESEIIQNEDDFLIQTEETDLVCEPVVEEVVETEAITLQTSDGQLVRVISRDQYERILEAARNRTFKCETCNKTFATEHNLNNHYKLSWEHGGCISSK